MTLGEKLWTGKGKSIGPGFIKSITMDGLVSMYSWTAEMKGLGRAKNVDGLIHVTATGKRPPKGIASESDLGTFMTKTGEGCVIKGYCLMKMKRNENPLAVGLWHFGVISMTLDWMNDLIALVIFEALDPMWKEFNVSIHEWK